MIVFLENKHSLEQFLITTSFFLVGFYFAFQKLIIIQTEYKILTFIEKFCFTFRYLEWEMRIIIKKL